jgi:hypothetical protein
MADLSATANAFSRISTEQGIADIDDVSRTLCDDDNKDGWIVIVETNVDDPPPPMVVKAV